MVLEKLRELHKALIDRAKNEGLNIDRGYICTPETFKELASDGVIGVTIPIENHQETE